MTAETEKLFLENVLFHRSDLVLLTDVFTYTNAYI